MNYEWDKTKAVINLRKHDVAFESMNGFVWDQAQVSIDSRRNYRESRLIAVSPIGGRLHVLVFTQRGYTVRVISLRKANEREISKYEKAKEEIRTSTPHR